MAFCGWSDTNCTRGIVETIAGHRRLPSLVPGQVACYDGSPYFFSGQKGTPTMRSPRDFHDPEVVQILETIDEDRLKTILKIALIPPVSDQKQAEIEQVLENPDCHVFDESETATL